MQSDRFARDRLDFSAIVCSALAAADAQSVRPLPINSRATIKLYGASIVRK